MLEGVSQCEGVSECVRVCPSMGGCVPVWECVSKCGRVCPSVCGCIPVLERVPVWEGVFQCGSVHTHTYTHIAYTDITHAALLTTRVFPTTLYI